MSKLAWISSTALVTFVALGVYAAQPPTFYASTSKVSLPVVKTPPKASVVVGPVEQVSVAAPSKSERAEDKPSRRCIDYEMWSSHDEHVTICDVVGAR